MLVEAALPRLNQCRCFSELEGNPRAHTDLVSHLGFGFILILVTKPKKAPLKNCQKLTQTLNWSRKFPDTASDHLN